MDKHAKVRRIGPLGFLVHILAFETLLIGYFGPDVIMPLGSALAASFGIALMFWHRGVRFVKAVSRKLTGTRTDARRKLPRDSKTNR